MHSHFLIQLLTGFTLSAHCLQQGLAETTTAVSVAGRRPISTTFVTAVRQTAPSPTLSSINPATTASAISPSLQPVDEIDGRIQEVAGSHTTVLLLSKRSVPDPIRYPMCKRYLNLFFTAVSLMMIDMGDGPDSLDGKRLHREMQHECGVVTAWHYHPKGGIVPGADFNFNLPWIYPSGCVEKAVVAAGGVKDFKC